MDRFVTVWNSFAGVAGFGADLKPVKKFENRDKALARIWKALQRLNGGATVEDASTAETAATAPKGANTERAKGKSGKKAAPPKKAPKTRSKATKPAKGEAGAPREDSKKAWVIAMLQRKNGATLPEIMEEMGWQAHTVRGFMAGTLKNSGYQIESFKPEGGERTYRINTK
jgi:heme-binding NEAT domain protein